MDRRITAERTAMLIGGAVDRAPAYLGIAEALRILIADGRIPPETRLPSERELTTKLGVSRTTVTRAYSLLRESGHLVSRQGSGSVTQLPSSAHVGDLLLNPEAPPGRIDLTCASPTAPPGIMQAYEAALAELPAHLPLTGYYPSGLPLLRQAIARRYAERGLPTEPEQVLVTSGALAAMAVVVRAFVDRGDRVLTESPSYPNVLAALRDAGARLFGADVEQRGWATSSVLDAVRQVRPAAAYLMPDFHNPTGQLMDDDERAALATALRRARTLTVVDETMVEIAIDEVVTPLPFAAHLPDAISIGSASKAFWGGLRIGWVRAPERRMAALVSARLTLDLGAPVLEQLVLLNLMQRREEVLELKRRRLRESRAALVAALAAKLPDWRFQVPAGGLSLWCELPRPVSSALTQAAADHGVQLAAGPLFAPEGGLERRVRLPYSQSPTALADAVDRLARAWEEGLPRRTTRRRVPALVT
ncbi:PLP-dependent aminotransferase family protein [Nocardioides caldifontis]|uniref:MocR-like transcription factor YczR n=1 Tax=Nocardioides caldifontis TaxID=2588938 RepID=UPI0011DF96C0|nr:PLP-dependent aminotransferase family protein [Nocardioides caldifontis]